MSARSSDSAALSTRTDTTTSSVSVNSSVPSTPASGAPFRRHHRLSAPDLPTATLDPVRCMSDDEIAAAIGAARLLSSMGTSVFKTRAAIAIERDCTRAMAKGLMRAAFLGDTAATSRMLEGGVVPDATDDYGRTALIAAAANKCNRSEIIRQLCGHGCDIDATDELGMNAVTWAAISGMPSHISELVGFGATVSACDKKGTTALMHAARAGKVECVTLLLRLGAPSRRTNKVRAQCLLP